jgi:DNA polymerase (family 10)/putative hydrolase
MKTWQRYKRYLLTGEWHVHTSYTDGKSSVTEYCESALKHSIPLLAFTEHVTKKLNYDFDNLLNDIDKAKSKYDLIILSGCEVKVLPDGSLNVLDEIIERVDYPIFAFHAFPKDPDLFLNCLRKVILDPRLNAWAHPLSFFENNNINFDLQVIEEILRMMKQYNVLLECNRKHNGFPSKLATLAHEIGVSVVKGSDIHSVNDFVTPFFGTQER